MSLIHNERTKLSATWLNTLAAATVATGVIAPIAAVVFGLPTTVGISLLYFVLAALLWLILGIVLHLGARYILGRLQE
jgi:dipeptide/tripeptide permease